MKTLSINRYRVTALHLLFWIVSFNIFSAFFCRGVESGYVVEDLNFTGWEIFIINNSIIFFLLAPCIWFFKEIKRWIKWSVTALLLIVIGWGIARMLLHADKDITIFPIIIYFFLDNFLYVSTFHITIIAAIYLNSGILIKKYLSQGKFGYYLIVVTGLAIIAGFLNYALFDLFIDRKSTRLNSSH